MGIDDPTKPNPTHPVEECYENKLLSFKAFGAMLFTHAELAQPTEFWREWRPKPSESFESACKTNDCSEKHRLRTRVLSLGQRQALKIVHVPAFLGGNQQEECTN